jgi:thiamine-phosphate pyrophosphorylase
MTRQSIRSGVRGLYAVTAQTRDTDLLVYRAEEALAGGARVLQYRDKSADTALRARQARLLCAACRRHGALFIVNDDVELAAQSGADGVHIGREDLALAAARSRLGPDAIIGASCYNHLRRAAIAVQGGADYVAFGSVYPSRTKPGAVYAPLTLFDQARSRIDVPLVAIGGITLANARVVVDAGADAVAVLSALFDASDVRAAAREFAALFTSIRHHEDP